MTRYPLIWKRYRFVPMLIFIILTIGFITPFAPTAAQSPPSELTAIAVSTGEIDLAWPASSDAGATSYAIRLNGQALSTVDSGTLMYMDTSVQPSTEYTYTVDTLDAAGTRLASSKPA